MRAAARAFTIAAVLASAAAPSIAGYAIEATWIDPNGVTVTVRGDDAEYHFYRRVRFREPRGDEGKSFRDDDVALDAFPFRTRRVRFSDIREARFEWKTERSTEQLVCTIETTTGSTHVLSGAELEGAAHPRPPFLSFVAPGGPVVLPLHPMTPAALRAGSPQIVRIAFPGNPDRRRPPRRPRPPRTPKPPER